MKTIETRLEKGDDLYDSILRIAKKNHIRAGVILSGVGCVSKARIRDSQGVDVHEIVENMEIVSLTGTISEEGLHLHISLSRKDLSVIGGHLKEGTIISLTCELVIGILKDCEFERILDEKTGYKELKIKKTD
ncbi:MAG: PPC domain-containing DNA-binding protein [Bacilli bacterium]